MVTYMLPIEMAELRYYLDLSGISPFEKWFTTLDFQAAAKVTTALVRIELGNTSNVKSLGSGLSEIKIDWGPGYRIYFGRDGDDLVILLTGGTKKHQDKDIKTAKLFWQDYKQRRKS
jgi:putative addiction module killer protein